MLCRLIIVGGKMSLEESLKTIADIKKEIDKLFREAWSHFPRVYEYFGFYEPPFDLEDTGNEYIIYMDIPGFSKDEIKIKVSEDLVEVKAEKGEEFTETRNFIVKQRVYRGFHKIIKLPAKVRPDEAKAVLENGVLQITLPKAGISREVEIKVE